MSTPAAEPAESGIAPAGASSAAAADSSTDFFADVQLHKPSKFVVDVSSGATSLIRRAANMAENDLPTAPNKDVVHTWAAAV